MKPKNSILLVVNPISGDCDKEIIVNLVRSEVLNKQFHLEIYNTTGKEDEAAISQIIKNTNPSRILVAGGDGTISLVANCIHGKDVILGIIPAGSANGMAVNIGLPVQLQEQVDVALSENILRIDTVFIDGRLCLHIADLGINAELIKNYESSGIRGKLGYFLQSIPTIFNSDSPYEFSIETEAGIITESGVLVAIANANKFGTGANINPQGKINDGKFEVLVFKSLDFIEILKTAQDNPEMSPEFVKIISTNKAKITSKTEVPFQIDGEFVGKTDSIKVVIERESLSLAVPKAFSELNNHKNNL